MDIAALKDLIDSDAGNAARTDQEVLDWLDTATGEAGPVRRSQALAWAAEKDVLRLLEVDRDNIANSDQKRGIARALIDLIRLEPEVDLRDSHIDQILADADTHNVWSSTRVNQYKSLGTPTKKRWRIAGFKKIDDASWLAHIAAARAR